MVHGLPLRLKSILRGRRVEQELDEELRFHLEHKIEEGIAGGLSPAEARYAAPCARWADWNSARKRCATCAASTG